MLPKRLIAHFVPLAAVMLAAACGGGGLEQASTPPPAETGQEAAAGGSEDGCPTAEMMAETIEGTFRRQVEVERVRPAALPGLCEVVASLRGSRSIIYSDPSGRYLMTGQIVDTRERRDLTREALAELNRFTPEEMKRLETLTALTVGAGGPEVYFVTDPQ